MKKEQKKKSHRNPWLSIWFKLNATGWRGTALPPDIPVLENSLGRVARALVG